MRRVLLLAAVAVLAIGVVSPAAFGGKDSGGKGIYDSTVYPMPGNLPSVGAEAYSFKQFGDEITFAGKDRALNDVHVTLSSWGCQSGRWNTGDCVSAKKATFEVPITLTIYNAGPGGTVGSAIATKTQSFDVAYRPSADNAHCTGGRWYDKHHGCFNGLADEVTFDFTGMGVTLPETVVYGISYNTTHNGPSPIGESAPCYATSGGCPYDALNIALAPEVTAGSKPFADTVFQDTIAALYCDGGAAGTNVFRLDSPSSACWGGLIPAVQFTAKKKDH